MQAAKKSLLKTKPGQARTNAVRFFSLTKEEAIDLMASSICVRAETDLFLVQSAAFLQGSVQLY